jgi:hypothetical protein
MFARKMTFFFKPENIDDAVKLFRTSVIPGARKEKGFRGACLMTDRPTGKGIAVTFWRNEADARANEENLFFQEQLVKFLPYFAGPPIREGFEVSVHCMETQLKRKSSKKPKKEYIG